MAWTDLLAALTVKELGSRLQTYWTAIGVVAALIATMSQTAFMAMPTPDPFYSEVAASALIQVYTISAAISFMSTMATVLCSTIFYAQVNQIPSSEALLPFLRDFQGVFGLPTIFFQIGCISLAVSLGLWAFISMGPLKPAPYVIIAIFALSPIGLFRVFNAMQKESVDIQGDVKRERNFTVSEGATIRFSESSSGALRSEDPTHSMQEKV